MSGSLNLHDPDSKTDVGCWVLYSLLVRAIFLGIAPLSGSMDTQRGQLDVKMSEDIRLTTRGGETGTIARVCSGSE